MAPMGPRSPRPHNPAHPRRPLLHLTTHSLGSHHKPGGATGSGFWLGVQNLSLPIQAYHLRFSPAGNQGRCHSGRRILGREPLSRWCLLGLIASLGKNELLARRENHLLDCKKTVSTPQSTSPRPGDSVKSCWGFRHSHGAKPQERQLHGYGAAGWNLRIRGVLPRCCSPTQRPAQRPAGRARTLEEDMGRRHSPVLDQRSLQKGLKKGPGENQEPVNS